MKILTEGRHMSFEEEKKTYQHGGKRNNSGRKPSGRKPRITIGISRDSLDWLRKQDESYGVVVDKLIEKELHND